MAEFLMTASGVIAVVSYIMFRFWKNDSEELRARMESAGFPSVDASAKRRIYQRICRVSGAAFLILICVNAFNHGLH